MQINYRKILDLTEKNIEWESVDESDILKGIILSIYDENYLVAEYKLTFTVDREEEYDGTTYNCIYIDRIFSRKDNSDLDIVTIFDEFVHYDIKQIYDRQEKEREIDYKISLIEFD